MIRIFLFLTVLAGWTENQPARDHNSEFERQVIQAGLIVVGTALSVATRQMEGVGESIVATIDVEEVLAGEMDQDNIAVVIWAPVSHYDVDCCREDCRYIFLLEETDGYYYATRFGRGVHAIDDSPPCYEPIESF